MQPILLPDGSISYMGYTIPRGAAQYDDVCRLRAGDPKAPFLITARYEGDAGIQQLWPGFATWAGLGDAS